MEVEGAAAQKQYYVGDSAVLARREGMEVSNPVQDGVGALLQAISFVEAHLCHAFLLLSLFSVSDWEAA